MDTPFLNLTMKIEDVQNATSISFFSKGAGHTFTEFACCFRGLR